MKIFFKKYGESFKFIVVVFSIILLAICSFMFFAPVIKAFWTYLESIISGISSEVETPDPIPNSAVKHFSTDDISALAEEK